MDFDKDPEKAKDYLTQYTQAVGNDDPKRADAVSAAQGAEVTRALLLACIVSTFGGALLLAPGAALAGKPARTVAKNKPAAARAAPAKKAASPAPATTKERTPSAASSETESASADTARRLGQRRVRAPTARRGGRQEGEVSKTYTFGAMDVEGKLKTPQLLYFLNRVKLELDMSAPDKRSFMKELQQSADDKNL